MSAAAGPNVANFDANLTDSGSSNSSNNPTSSASSAASPTSSVPSNSSTNTYSSTSSVSVTSTMSSATNSSAADEKDNDPSSSPVTTVTKGVSNTKVEVPHDPSAPTFLLPPLIEIIFSYLPIPEAEWVRVSQMSAGGAFPQWIITGAVDRLINITANYQKTLPKIDPKNALAKYLDVRRQALGNDQYFSNLEKSIAQYVSSIEDEKLDPLDPIDSNDLRIFCQHRTEKVQPFIQQAITNQQYDFAARLIDMSGSWSSSIIHDLRLPGCNLNLLNSLFCLAKENSLDDALESCFEKNKVIHHVALTGKLECIQFFIRHYPNLINSLDNEGNTPLQIAARHKHYRIFKLILAANLNVDPGQWALFEDRRELDKIYNEIRFPQLCAAGTGETDEKEATTVTLVELVSEINTNIENKQFSIVASVLSENYARLLRSQQLAIKQQLDDADEKLSAEIGNLASSAREMATAIARTVRRFEFIDPESHLYRFVAALIFFMAATGLMAFGFSSTRTLSANQKTLDLLLGILSFAVGFLLCLKFPLQPRHTTLESLPAGLTDRAAKALKYGVERYPADRAEPANLVPELASPQALQGVLATRLQQKRATSEQLQRALQACSGNTEQKRDDLDRVTNEAESLTTPLLQSNMPSGSQGYSISSLLVQHRRGSGLLAANSASHGDYVALDVDDRNLMPDAPSLELASLSPH